MSSTRISTRLITALLLTAPGCVAAADPVAATENLQPVHPSRNIRTDDCTPERESECIAEAGEALLYCLGQACEVDPEICADQWSERLDWCANDCQQFVCATFTIGMGMRQCWPFDPPMENGPIVYGDLPDPTDACVGVVGGGPPPPPPNPAPTPIPGPVTPFSPLVECNSEQAADCEGRSTSTTTFSDDGTSSTTVATSCQLIQISEALARGCACHCFTNTFTAAYDLDPAGI